MAAILIPLAISAAITAASTGLEYLIAKKQKVSPVDRGKQDDIRISIPGYGEQIIKSWGTARGAPIWFWHTPIVDRPIVTPGHSGGKGPPKPPTPTTTDHQYYTSIAGVFADCSQGPIETVNRIWFNSDLVWNLTGLSATRYEAENGTLGGTATSVLASYASNGRGVTHLGTGGGDNGYVDFAVTISDTGNYDVAIGYQSDSITYSFEVRVDGVLVGTVSCPPSGVGLIGIQTIGLTLTAGAHTIRLGNTTGNSAPNLDYIDIVETVSFAGGSLADSRVFTELNDPTALAASDQTKAWANYNAKPLELSSTGTPLTGTTTLTATLTKWGNPEIRIYRGTTDQPADPAIIADKGVTNTPAFRGFAYIVIDNILLQNGALPNVTIEWKQGITAVDQIVIDHYALGGVTSGNLNLTALSGLTITGVLRTSQKPLGDSIKDLQTRFQFDLIEVDGIVKAVLRNGTSADLTIPYSELRAHEDGSETPVQDATIKDIDPRLLPYEVQVNYLDPGNDYHNGVQSDFRASGPELEPVSVSLSLVDNQNNMKKLASTLLYKPDMEGREISFETGPKYVKVVPGTIVDLQLPNATHRVRITDGKYGLPAGVMQFQSVRQAASLYNPTGFGTISGREDPVAGFPSNTKGVLLDGPLFRPEDGGDGTDPVIYEAMCGIGGGAWPGCSVLQENPFNSGNYIFITTHDKPSGIGVTTSALPSVADPSVWDTTSSLIVNFYFDPQLATATTTDVENNPNLNLIAIKNPATGDVECVQFKNATPGTPASPFVAQYTLDHFLRGRFNTEANVGAHSSADNVVFIDTTVKARRQRNQDIGQTLHWKFVTSGQNEDAALVNSEVLHGYSLRPPIPTGFNGLIDDLSGDILFDWEGTPASLPSLRELYDLEISIPGSGNFSTVRSITGLSLNDWNQYVIWDGASFNHSGGICSYALINPGGVALSVKTTSGTADAFIYAKQQFSIEGGITIQFRVPPTNPIISLFGIQNITASSPFDYVLTITRSTLPDANGNFAVYINGSIIAYDHFVPGDQWSIVIRPDGQIQVFINQLAAQANVPIYTSPTSIDPTATYRIVVDTLRDLGNPVATQTSSLLNCMIQRNRNVPEWRYIASAQQADNSGQLPVTIKARVRQESFVQNGPPSGWLYGTFNFNRIIPFRQTDWPNPVPRKRYNQYHTLNKK